MIAITKSTLTLVNTFILASLSIEDAKAKLSTAYLAEKISKADLKIALQMGYCHHKASYRADVDAEGNVTRDSALAKRISRDVAAIEGKSATKTADHIVVSRATKALCMEFLAHFDGKTLDAQIAQARKVLSAMK